MWWASRSSISTARPDLAAFASLALLKVSALRSRDYHAKFIRNLSLSVVRLAVLNLDIASSFGGLRFLCGNLGLRVVTSTQVNGITGTLAGLSFFCLEELSV